MKGFLPVKSGPIAKVLYRALLLAFFIINQEGERMTTKKIKLLHPPATIGIIGGGQLGRMLVFEAKRMGFNVIVLDPKPCSSAGQVADEQIVASYSNLRELRELARKSDVITYEFEHIDVELLNVIESDGYSVYPSSNTLKRIQNKYIQKSMLKNIGVKVPYFCLVQTFEELKSVFHRLDHKIILKTCTDGYDGKGNTIVNNLCELEKAYQKFRDQELMVEEYIDFIKEVSIVIAKNEEGIVYYPIAENFHRNGILIKSLIPANITSEIENSIHLISKKIVEELNDFGVFCIEFFIDSGFNVLVNEIAPRPHNSGHYTIEGCVSSQFEQLVRIVCGMPLGSTELRMPCAMYNILGSQITSGPYDIGGVDSILRTPDCHLHLYGKTESYHLKKIGHITALDISVEAADNKAEQALNNIEVNAKAQIK